MFKHEIAGMEERLTLLRRGLGVRVVVTLLGPERRAPFRVAVDADPGVALSDLPEGWTGVEHRGVAARFKVTYASNRDGALPAVLLDGPTEWRASWATLKPHPALERARARKRKERTTP